MNVAIVGLGNMGRNHLRVCLEIEELNIIGISDINKDLGMQLAQKYNIKYLENYQDLVKLTPDFICVAVPTFFHYEICKYFIKNKVNVLLEKPITKELWQAEELINLSKLYNVKVLIGHIERFNNVYKALKNCIVERNEDIIAVEINRMSHNDKILDVNVVLDLMVHDIDLMFNINQFNINTIKSVEYSNHKNSLDYCISIFKFHNNSIGKITSSRITEQKIREINITTNKSFYKADLLSKEIVISSQTQLNYNNDNHIRQKNIIEKILIQQNNALKDEILHFIDVLKNNTTLLIDLKQGYHVLKYAYEVINSCN